MKKYFMLVLSILIIAFTSAQTYDTTTYYGKMGFIFNNLDRTQITTGLLRDYGIDFVNLDNYNGKILNDTNWITLPDWRSIYTTLYSEQIKSPANMLYLDTLNRLISRFALSNLPVTFTSLYYNFNVLDSNAAINHLITVATNGQLNDVAGRTQSPYLLHSVFAIAPTQQAIYTGSNQLILRPELFLTNTGKTISTLQIDPKGSGTYQTVSFNLPVTVSYDTAGLYIVNFKITYTDGTINYSHTKLVAYGGSSSFVSNYGHGSPPPFKGYGPPYFEEPFIFGTKGGSTFAQQSAYYISQSVNFTADKQYLGVPASGDYVIDLSKNHTSLQKPLIVISGFDPEAVDNSTGLLYFDDYVQRIKYDWNIGSSIPLNSTNGLDDADSYDIIYLHWHNGTDYIERNAYLLEKLITIVNGLKTANGSTEKNVIIGTSMGGLVARWALRDMELNNIPHDTRLFISHDAPHWGANVPVAYQAMVQYIAPWQIVTPGINFPILSIRYQDMFPDAINAVGLFNSPAAKQMLIQRYNLNTSNYTLTADNSTHNNFMTEINNMGWPLNCRNIVLSNGACNGTLTFPDNNNQFLNIYGSWGWTYFGGLWRGLAMSIGGIPGVSAVIAPGVPVRNTSLLVQFPLSLISTKQTMVFDWGAWAVPTSGLSLIFKGNVYISRVLLWGLGHSTSYILKSNVYSSTDMLPLDNAPGGKYDIGIFGVNTDDINTQLKAQLGNSINLHVNQFQFCFVPTVSSLALSNPQQNLRVSLCNNVACLLPAGVKDYFAPQANELHISYTTNNSNWILQRQDANYNCTQICAPNYPIVGDNSFCITSNPYSIPNLPGGASITWSAIPSGVVTINSPNSLQTTLTKISAASVTLTATIANTCSANNILIQKPVASGGDMPTSISGMANGKQFVKNCTYTFSSTGTSWLVNPGTILSGQGTQTITVQTANTNTPYFNVSVRQTNSCGLSGYYTLTGSIVNGACAQLIAAPLSRPALNNITEIEVYPNPAHSSLFINLPIDSIDIKSAYIIITDITGKQVKRLTIVKQSNAVDIKELAAGTYTVEINDGKKQVIKRVVKY